MSYRKLEIWRLAREVSAEIHAMTLSALPKFELYEQGSQIRRSAHSIHSNIVEGYGRRRYKQDFIRFLTYAHSSCDETVDHLESLFETRSLSDSAILESLRAKLNSLGAKLNVFIQSVDSDHISVREDAEPFGTAEDISRSSSIP